MKEKPFRLNWGHLRNFSCMWGLQQGQEGSNYRKSHAGREKLGKVLALMLKVSDLFVPSGSLCAGQVRHRKLSGDGLERPLDKDKETPQRPL